jgi:uncharacterized membrane protein
MLQYERGGEGVTILNMDLRTIVRTAVIAGVAIAFQALNLRQPITGPGINAILYVASIYIGPVSGVLVGLLTPWIALITGIMGFAPAVPVIMAGNATLALVSGFLHRFNRYLAMGLAALGKFIVMTLGIRYLMAHGTQVPAPAYTSLTITQLITALAGAVVASVVLGGLERFGGNGHGRSCS